MNQNPQSPVETRIVSNETIPARLFTCFAEVNQEVGAALSKTYVTGENLPNDLSGLHKQHLLHTYRLGENGSIWEAGPSAGFTRDLFQSWIVADLKNKCEEFAKRWRSSEQFDETKCRYVLYVYLASLVAVALTATVERRPEFALIIANLKELSHSKVRSEWSVNEAKFDDDIEEAGSTLAQLIFEKPSQNRALSFEWLSHCTIESLSKSSNLS